MMNHIQDFCTLSKMAAADPTLMKNHIDNNVPKRLKKELKDIELCLKSVIGMNDQDQFIKELNQDKIEVENAIRVYEDYKN